MILETLCLIGSALLLLYILYYAKKQKNEPPGPITIPMLGNVVQLYGRRHLRPYDMFRSLSEEYGPVSSFTLGSLKQVIIDDFKTAREVLNSDVWLDRVFSPYLAERSFGKELGILMINGSDVWREMRRFSIRTLRDFGFGKQKSMEEILEDEISDLMKHLNSQMEASRNIVDMKHFFTISILNILWNMIAGYRFDRSDKRLHKLLHLLDRLVKASAIGTPRISAAVAFPFMLFLINTFTQHKKIRWDLFEGMHSFFRTLLEERRKDGHFKEEQRDFIDVFLKEIDNNSQMGKHEKNYYTDEQFIIVCMDLFMAGSETSSNSMEFGILYMLLHPQVQKKVQAEIDLVVGQNRLPSLQDRTMMPYTEATLLEILRLANVIPILIRAPSEDTKIGEYDIQKGTIGVINLHSIHMNEKQWTNPSEFNPNRFLDREGNVINANKILPFGSGKRSCLGEALARASLFIFFTTFLQRYTFEPSPDHEIPTMEPVLGFTLSPKPYHALVTSRLS